MYVQDLFETADGQKLIDVDKVFTVKLFESFQDGEYGEKMKIVLTHEGEDYEWKNGLKPDRFKQVFTESNKSPSGEFITSWEAQVGDEILVRLQSPKGGKFPFYNASPYDGKGVPAPVKTVTGNTPQRPTSTGDSKWDGTPRQLNYKNQLATIVAGLIASGNYDISDGVTAKLSEDASNLLIWCRQTGDELEASNPSH